MFLSNVSYDPGAYVIALLSLLTSLYMFIRTPNGSIYQERYLKLIFPLFILIEPYLYKDIPSDKLDEILSLIEKNKAYAGSPILESFYFCNRNRCKENFFSLCDKISHTYDYHCIMLGLKRRSIAYRITRNQYRTKFMLFLYATVHVLLYLLMMLLFLCLLNFLGFRFSTQ